MRKVQLMDYLNEYNKLEPHNIERYIRDNNYQVLRCNSMVKYGIQTILINDYDEITLMLKHLYNKYITNNVFISGELIRQIYQIMVRLKWRMIQTLT